MSQPTTVFETDGFRVVNKPAGWLAHPVGTKDPDLIQWLPRGLVPVHRLDKETSGLIICADEDRRAVLSEAFEAGEVDKTYIALVNGLTRKKGVIRRPLKDARRGRPVEAETRYKTLEHLGRWSLIELSPVKGRKHQIRRHLQGIGHSIVGDARYGPKRRISVPGFPGRLWLHASALVLAGHRHEAPLPPELQEHLELLRARASAASAEPSSV